MENYSKADTVKNATLRFLVVSQRPTTASQAKLPNGRRPTESGQSILVNQLAFTATTGQSI